MAVHSAVGRLVRPRGVPIREPVNRAPGRGRRPPLELPPSWHFPVRETKGKGTL